MLWRLLGPSLVWGYVRLLSGLRSAHHVTDTEELIDLMNNLIGSPVFQYHARTTLWIRPWNCTRNRTRNCTRNCIPKYSPTRNRPWLAKNAVRGSLATVSNTKFTILWLSTTWISACESISDPGSRTSATGQSGTASYPPSRPTACSPSPQTNHSRQPPYPCCSPCR